MNLAPIAPKDVLVYPVAKDQCPTVPLRQRLLQVLADAPRRIELPCLVQAATIHDLHASQAIQRLEAQESDEGP